jgi:hypothetical protein
MYLFSSHTIAVIPTWEAPRNYYTVLSALSGYYKGEGLVLAWQLTTTFDADIMMIAEFHGLYTVPDPVCVCDRYCRLLPPAVPAAACLNLKQFPTGTAEPRQVSQSFPSSVKLLLYILYALGDGCPCPYTIEQY